MGKYLEMMTPGMVLNGVLEVLEKARITNYDPDKAVEELALSLAIVCQMTKVPVEDGIRILEKCVEVQDSARHFAHQTATAEA